MACLFQRNNGIYYVVTTRKGKRNWISLHTRDREEALLLFDELARSLPRRSSLTVELFCQNFLSRAHLSVSEKTISMYQSAFNNFVRVCGNRSLRTITPLTVEEYKLQRAKEVSPVTVNIELRSLRAAFAEGARLKELESNPFEGVRQVRVPYKEGRYLNEKDFTVLTAAIEDVDFRGLITFAVLTMMRRGEIINLRWADVDLPNRRILVQHHGTFRVKGGKPRAIPMHNWVHSMLSSKERRGTYVFGGERQMNGKALSSKFKRYVRLAGLDESLHFHSLRHTGISWLINKGVAPQFVQRLAGHSSLRVTEVYSHLEDTNLVLAINTPRMIGALN